MYGILNRIRLTTQGTQYQIISRETFVSSLACVLTTINCAMFERLQRRRKRRNALGNYHEKGSLTNKIHLLKRICSTKLVENGNMGDHLGEITCLIDRLSAMGENLAEYLVVAMILSSLPESYSGLITALESRPEEDLRLEFIKGKLMDEWRRRIENGL